MNPLELVDFLNCNNPYDNKIELQMKSDNLQKEIGGWDIDFLCKTCYKTLSAEKWDEFVEELEDKHQWDNE